MIGSESQILINVKQTNRIRVLQFIYQEITKLNIKIRSQITIE
jgi:type IV secretory pathway VirB9-like protein